MINTYSIFTKVKKRIVYRFAKLYSDRSFLEVLFPLRTGYKLNLDNPQTFNEKLQWLKLFDRRQEYAQMVDKVEAKKYVANIIGEEYIIPTLAVYERAEDIDFDKLPNQFVLKCTHDSGGIVICQDKTKLDHEVAIKKLSHGLSVNYFYQNREWPYKNVKPRIIAEQYMEDEDGDLRDYKFFCFNGKVKIFKIDFDRFADHHANYYDSTGKLLPFGEANYPPNPLKQLEIPKELPQMVLLSEKLSHGIPFLRVDFYNTNGKIFFGELTFFPASGMGPFDPMEWDNELGQLIQLPLSK